jgi:hypothetical protein
MMISCNLFKDSETEEMRKELAELKKEKEEQKNSNKDANPETEETTEKSKEESKTEEKAKPKPKKEPALPINKNEVSDLIDSWERAQNEADYNTYKSLYATEFSGIKRTTSGKVSRLNYNQWLNDRRKMLKNIKSVTITNTNVTIVGNTATAEFTQDFESNNYQDTGQKILKIQMFSSGPKIIYEEMKDSN